MIEAELDHLLSAFDAMRERGFQAFEFHRDVQGRHDALLRGTSDPLLTAVSLRARNFITEG